MNFDVALGILYGVLAIIVAFAFVHLGSNLNKAKIKSNINLCGHTIECYERVVFDGEGKKND